MTAPVRRLDWDERRNYTRRRLCCSKPGPSSRVKPLPGTVSGAWWWSTGWRGWSNWELAKPVTSDVPNPVPVVLGRQPDPTGQQSRSESESRLRFHRRQNHDL